MSRKPCFSSQLLPLAGTAEEDVGLEEHRQHQRAVRRSGGVAVALWAPDVIPGGHLALVILEAALDDKGLLDLDMLVQRQFGAGLPAEDRGQEPGLVVFDEHLQPDAGARGRLPGQAADIDIARRKWAKPLFVAEERRRCGHCGLL